jgi:hypothetical protein
MSEVHAKVIPGTKTGTPGADSNKAKAAITWVAVADRAGHVAGTKWVFNRVTGLKDSWGK